MLFFTKPTSDDLRRFVSEQSSLDFTYAAVGSTAATPPAGFTVDRTRVELGAGEAVFQAAREALERWHQFRLGWVDIWSPDTPLEVGQVVAIMGRGAGCWWLNACRIVYTVDETEPTTRFGFANGTLPGHVQSGEERFLIEWDRGTDLVSYEILAFSRPYHIASRVGYPFVRRSQKRFGRESAAAMFHAVQGAASIPRVVQSSC